MVLAWYTALSLRRPWSTAFVTCTAKGCASDLIVQVAVEGHSEVDLWRNAVFAFYGGWYCGCFQHGVYNVLYGRLFGTGTGIGPDLRQVVFHSAFHVPFVVYPVYYSYKAVLYDGQTAGDGIRRYGGEWQEMCQNYYSVWVPANLLVFTVVPEPLRVAFIATTSFVWLGAVSFLTHRREAEKH